jgi:hypothetical protein
VTRRQVRVTSSFFERLDELLPSERGDDGTPSATDFLLHDLPAIIDLLAEDFERRTAPVADDPEIRVLVAVGVLIPFVAAYAVLAADDNVDVIYLELG